MRLKPIILSAAICMAALSISPLALSEKAKPDSAVVDAHADGGCAAVERAETSAAAKATTPSELLPVTGTVVVHNINNDNDYLDLSKVSLIFTAQDDPAFAYTVSEGGMADNRYAISIAPDHTYIIEAVGNSGYELSALSGTYEFSRHDALAQKNILFTETISDVPYTPTVHVGEDKEYARINDAITAIRAMSERPCGEDGRVTVVIDPGIYTEQLIIDADYVTLKAADANNRPKISFYYGLGYLYYSSDRGGFYNEDCAVAKTGKNPASRWGCTIRVKGLRFIAENIIFENSFNCRIVPEEIADGVEPSGKTVHDNNIIDDMPDRTQIHYDPSAKKALERAAVFVGEGMNYELYMCDFISSQDTLFTKNTGYFRDCYIEGSVDYIFGGDSVVFDGCTLAWHGCSDKKTDGYITASQTAEPPVAGVPNPASNGYLFTNCTITTSKYFPNHRFTDGYLGRNWGGTNCQVVFKDTQITDGVAVPKGWKELGGKLNASTLYVDPVFNPDDTTLALLLNPNGTMEDNHYTPMRMTDYFGPDWIPVHYDGELPT